MLLIKHFTGYEPLQYMVIIMIVYAPVKLFFEIICLAYYVI